MPMAHARREILSRVYLQNYCFEHLVAQEDLRAGYEYNRTNGKIQEYWVHQILVATRAEAKQILGRCVNQRYLPLEALSLSCFCVEKLALCRHG
jgi:hypothetical protein